MNNKQSISAHQVGVLAGILIFTLKMTSLPALMYEYSSTGAIFTIFTFVALNILFLYLLIKIKKKFPKTSFYELIKSKIGTILTKLIYIFLFAFFLIKILLVISDSFTFIKDIVDEEFQLITLLICFIPIISSLAVNGMRNLSRTCEFLFPFIMFCFILIIIFSFTRINNWELGNILREGTGSYFSSLLKLSFWTGDLLPLLLIFDKIEIKQAEKKQIFKPFLTMSVIFFLIYLLYFFVYQETHNIHTNVICDLLQYSVGTRNGWHMNIIAIVAFMFSILLQGGIFMFCTCASAKRIISFHYSKIIIVFIDIVLLFLSFFFLNDYLEFLIFAEDYLCYFSAGLFLIIAVLILVLLLSKQKGVKNGKKRAK